MRGIEEYKTTARAASTYPKNELPKIMMLTAHPIESNYCSSDCVDWERRRQDDDINNDPSTIPSILFLETKVLLGRLEKLGLAAAPDPSSVNAA